MPFRYLHYDVFAGSPLSGNQLAVFPEAAGLTADTMQRIALEMNFSETTFVFPAEAPGTDARVRIFTPGRELPMAGHPTIGTAFALVREGRVAAGAPRLTLGLGIGPTPVALEWRGRDLAFAWMRQPAPVFGTVLTPRTAVAAALSLDAGDLGPSDLPVQVVSCGVPFVLAPLASPAAVDRAELDRGAWRALCAAHGLDEQLVFLFSSDPASPAAVYSRMFGPAAGVTEDPGTGSASGPLGAYLVTHVAPDGTAHAFVSRQGVRMRRPCEIHVRVLGTPSRIDRVEVGGTATCAGEGILFL
jgi:trans-2,3-dihydro-3-hydroxyanthranilate isomerase